MTPRPFGRQLHCPGMTASCARLNGCPAPRFGIEAAIPPVALRWLVVRDPLGKFALQSFFCTLPAAVPSQMLAWFSLRWCVETTFEEARAHLGLETQR